MKKTIGVFDSGIGGLTVVKELVRKFPNLPIIYFGDTARVPYGSKSKEIITKYAIQDTIFLLSKGVEFIVAACNTVSSVCLDKLKETFRVPIIGVIEPACRKAVSVSKNNRVGIIGTVATIKSRAYEKTIKLLNNRIRVFSRACPLFVPLVEEGYIEKDATHTIVSEYLTPILRERVDTVVLGCTHYPLLKPVIRKIIGSGVNLIDSGSCVAEELESVLKNSKDESTNLKIFLSDLPPNFIHLSKKFLGKRVNRVKVIEIERYV